MHKLHRDLDRPVELAFENEIINATKSKAVHFTSAQVMEPLNYSLQNIVIPEASRNNFSVI
jgi:hypothetical protein